MNTLDDPTPPTAHGDAGQVAAGQAAAEEAFVAGSGEPGTDVVARIHAEWQRSHPDLDTTPIAILGRIQRISSVVTHRLDRNLDEHGISRSEFEVLGALVRAQRPLRASDVVSTTMLSGASITKLTEALAARGLIERRRSEHDGRVVLLAATDDGRALIDRVLPRRLAGDNDVLSALTGPERDQLTALLTKITRDLDGADRLH
ncbi:MarR family transcriptional regulator [Gordonia jinhuaensis]|uniref:MarR family transcriptional regulator n=1 Tax=Gordonia jinhuaensis TaxID=1517702 RepID=A0A916T7T1_9ACTN|nr:MarR family transcriptional regulator [Gordonia jinhuaensis]GGB34973.1 MarR family transcriptional regulator [Gordonia jinhuaensis]